MRAFFICRKCAAGELSINAGGRSPLYEPESPEIRILPQILKAVSGFSGKVRDIFTGIGYNKYRRSTPPNLQKESEHL